MSITAPTILYKQPSETRVYTMDFTNLLGSTTISSINSITSILRGGDISTLVLGEGSIIESNKKISISISGGIQHNTYRIEIIITASDGQILEGDVLLTITDL